MNRYAMEQLKEKLCRELEMIAEHRELSGSDLEKMQKMLDAVKNICKIEMYSSGGGYSSDGGMSSSGGNYAGGEGGSSYRHRNSMGQYAGSGYSRGGGYSGGTLEEHLEAMMRDARNEEERRMIEEMRRKLI